MIVNNYEENFLKKYKTGFISAYNELNSFEFNNELEAFQKFIDINKSCGNFEILDMKKSISMQNDIFKAKSVLNEIRRKREISKKEFELNKDFREIIKKFFNRYKK